MSFNQRILEVFSKQFIEISNEMFEDNLDLENGVHSESSRFSPDHEMVAMLAFSGSATGFLSISCHERSMAQLTGLKELPEELEELKVVRENYASAMSEAINTVTGNLVAELKKEFPIITIMTPRIYFSNQMIYPVVKCYHYDLKTKLGVFQFTFCVDTMEQEIIKLLEDANLLIDSNKRLFETNNQLHAVETKLIQDEKQKTIAKMSTNLAFDLSAPLAALINNFSVLNKTTRRFSDMMKQYRYGLDQIIDGKNAEEVKSKIELISKELNIDTLNSQFIETLGTSHGNIDKIHEIFSRIDKLKEDKKDDFIIPYQYKEAILLCLSITKTSLADIELIQNFDEVPSILCNPTSLSQALLEIIELIIFTIDLSHTEKSHYLISFTLSADNDKVYCSINYNGKTKLDNQLCHNTLVKNNIEKLDSIIDLIESDGGHVEVNGTKENLFSFVISFPKA